MQDSSQFELLDSSFRSTKELTILSYGAGQESTWLLYKLALGPVFRKRFAPGRLVVIGSDTGDEHDETYEHVEFTKEFCQVHGIEFHWITPDLGFHSEAWRTLIGQYRRNNVIGSKMFKRCCTNNLKIQPFYRFPAHWLAERSEITTAGSSKGSVFFRFAAVLGKINVILGFASTEARRAEKTLSGQESGNLISRFRKTTIEFSFPLIELGMDRAATQAEIRAMHLPLPPPSNCKRCHFRTEIELLWLFRFERSAYDEWVELEEAKLAKFAASTSQSGRANLGVFGKRTLPEVLAQAIDKYGSMTDDELEDYRMNHGHCVENAY